MEGVDRGIFRARETQGRTQPAILTHFPLRRAIRRRLLRCARSPCSTYGSSTPPRAELRAPRIHGLLTRLATELREKCGLERGFATVTITYTDGFFYFVDEDFAISDFAGP